ncbi:MAG: biopolymer transporter ExbD [Limnohabitans sp.]|nr:biopolymer transporter ExbD [Limnohabitans sp.]
MKFSKQKTLEPEINLIPFIDVLLVVVIFLVLSTTYSKLTEIQLNLPVADTKNLQAKNREIYIGISSDGRYVLQGQVLMDTQVESLAKALAQASKDLSQPVLIINADAKATHQSVIHVMEAAQRAGLGQITFATQQSNASR